MSTALRKQEPVLPDPYDTETAAIVRLETATETMMAYIGYLNTEIHNEEDQGKPNLARINALRKEKSVVLEERHSITPDNQELIAKALYVYAPIMKAIYTRHG